MEHCPVPGLSSDQFAHLVQLLGPTASKDKVEQGIDSPMANMTGKINVNNPWIIDSGATEHITCSEEYLHELNENGISLPVRIPNGESIPVKNIGSAHLPNGLEVKRVLNVLDFKCNLLSVSHLTRELNCSLIFYPEFCVLQDLRRGTRLVWIKLAIFFIVWCQLDKEVWHFQSQLIPELGTEDWGTLPQSCYRKPIGKFC